MTATRKRRWMLVSLLVSGLLTASVLLFLFKRPAVSSGRLVFLGISTTDGTNMASFRLDVPTNVPLSEQNGVCRYTDTLGHPLRMDAIVYTLEAHSVTILRPVPTNDMWCFRVDLYRRTRGLEVYFEKVKTAVMYMSFSYWQRTPSKLVQTLLTGPITNALPTADATRP